MSVRKALAQAKEAHEGQKRMNGEPYIRHPQRVSRKLKERGCPVWVQEAGLLHDTIEDSSITELELYKQYGIYVSTTVSALSIKKVGKKATPEEKRVYWEGIRMESFYNPYIIVIKLEDRIDNIKRMQYFDLDRKIKNIKETREMLIPIAQTIAWITTNKKVEKTINQQIHELTAALEAVEKSIS